MITEDPAAFASAVGGQGRLAALDLGEKTIGIATATADWRFATARETLRRTRPAADYEALARFAAHEGIVGLVIGLPVNLDGSASPRTRSARAQAANIARRTGLPVLLWDERWSTAAVTRAMLEADLSRAKRKAAVDQLAAAWILEGALHRLEAERSRP
ncbi:Holliday junction resolvase RuvX [Thermaurantiacus sp.]